MLHKLKSLSIVLIKMSFFSNLVEEEEGKDSSGQGVESFHLNP